MAGVFICFSHLTDQAFIWDRAAIWDRGFIPSSQKSGIKNFTVNSLASFCKWSCCGRGNDSANQYSLKLLHCKLLISAVTHSGVHLFHPDHFAGHSLMACPFVDTSSLHVYVRLLASLLPPSTRQPGPVAVLLGQMLKLTLIFSPISHSLGVDRETSRGCFSRVFLCIFYDRKFEFQVVLLIFLLHWSHGDHQCVTDWQEASTICEKGEKKNVQCQWSRLRPWFKKKKLIRPSIYLELAVIYQNIHLHLAFKGDPEVNLNPATIW